MKASSENDAILREQYSMFLKFIAHIFFRQKKNFFTFFLLVTGVVGLQAQTVNYYSLYVVPKNGGKLYMVYHSTKVKVITDSNKVISGKVTFIYQDAIEINNSNIELSSIKEIRYNPGSAIGIISAAAVCVGLAAIAITAGGGKDGEMSSTENAIFYSGIGLVVVGGISLIPNYFIKKRLDRDHYDFITKGVK